MVVFVMEYLARIDITKYSIGGTGTGSLWFDWTDYLLIIIIIFCLNHGQHKRNHTLMKK
jgi:hypothetical protein